MTKIELQDIRIQFRNRTVLDGFHLAVEPGEKVWLQGPSGSGKSTVLRLILGLEKPQAGKVFIDAELLTSRSVWSLRQKLAYVNQEATVGLGNVRAVLKEVLKYRANSHITFREEKVLELFDTFRLANSLLEQEVAQLSGGERQRIALVLALLLEREVMLLDEITSAIDSAAKRQVIDYLAGLDKTMVIVSHDDHWQNKELRQVHLD